MNLSKKKKRLRLAAILATPQDHKDETFTPLRGDSGSTLTIDPSDTPLQALHHPDLDSTLPSYQQSAESSRPLVREGHKDLSDSEAALHQSRPLVLNNEAPTSTQLLQIECEARAVVPESGPTKLRFRGYSGGPVLLASYGFDAPVYYNVPGIKIKQKIPILCNHRSPVGHTTTVKKPDNAAVEGAGIASYPGPETTQLTEAAKNGFPFQASMGVVVKDASSTNIQYLPPNKEGTINGRSVKGPAYFVMNSELQEMTITTFGRDSDTTFEILNKEQRDMIKNSVEGGIATPIQPPAPVAPPLFPQAAPPIPVTFNTQATFQLAKLMSKYPNHHDKIENMLKEDDDIAVIENSIKLELYESSLPKVPNSPPGEDVKFENNLVTRLALSVGIRPETLEKKYGKETTERAYDMNQLGIVETIMNFANATGGRFTGHSDVEEMCEHLKKHNLSGYSTFDMPNLLKKVTDIQLDERWELNEPFAPKHLKEESNKDFRMTQRVRPSGGEIWMPVKPTGKIDLTYIGKEQEYNSTLDTVATLLVLPREVIINDDMGVVSELIDAMVEGALMVPDKKLGLKMLAQVAAANTFWVNADNSLTGTALTQANLSTVYNNVRQYNEARGGHNWVNLLSDRWKIITSITGEETAWNILKQDRVVANASVTGQLGDKNYWFNKMDIAVFSQMSNTSLLGANTSGFIAEDTWLLWPSSKKYAPYSITYLRGRKRPTIERVTLPENMLGFGIRGYWDIEINERERLAVVRANA